MCICVYVYFSSWRYFRRKLRRCAFEPKPCDCLFWEDTVSAVLSIHFHSHTYINTLRPRSSGRCAVDIAKWTQDYLPRSCSGIRPELQDKSMEKNHSHTYIHTYIHTYPQAFIPAFFVGGNSHHGRRVSFVASYRVGRPCPRRHLTINGRVSILDAMYAWEGWAVSLPRRATA